MNRIENKFKQLKKDKKNAFIAFITAGYPNLSVTKKLILEFDRQGVDIVELGVPFSDPMADGPIIQESSQFALARNTQLKDILRLAKDVRKSTSIPLCLMTYYNPIFCFGEDKFVKAANACGVDGVIIPDLPPEEAGRLIKLANQKNLDIIYFIAPTTSPSRARFIAHRAKGFIYYVCLTGVTGARKVLPKDLTAQLKSLKRLTPKPICAGFGISNPRQVKELYKVCDGVIVGSAIVKAIKANLSRKDLVKRIGNFVRYLKDV